MFGSCCSQRKRLDKTESQSERPEELDEDKTKLQTRLVEQEKKCNDWDALREYAESKSADYFDVEPEKGVLHLNNYHAGDGLTW